MGRHGLPRESITAPQTPTTAGSTRILFEEGGLHQPRVSAGYGMQGHRDYDWLAVRVPRGCGCASPARAKTHSSSDSCRLIGRTATLTVCVPLCPAPASGAR